MSTFIFSLSSSALVHLGEIPEPQTNRTEVDLPIAKQIIDTLGMLQEKTKGNLDQDEERLLKSVLYDLRMRYVQKSGKVGRAGSHLIIERSVPAKINLWLEVIRKREDGYHDISSLMLPVSVFDNIRLDVRPGGGPISITCDRPEIPSDDRNLAWRAADLYLKKSGKEAGIHIQLEKHIPSGAGLGGGSSDAGGVLVALNSYFQNAVPPRELEELALEAWGRCSFFPSRKTCPGDRDR